MYVTNPFMQKWKIIDHTRLEQILRLYNVAMKGYTLSSQMFIWTYPFCFVVKKVYLKLQ